MVPARGLTVGRRPGGSRWWGSRRGRAADAVPGVRTIRPRTAWAFILPAFVLYTVFVVYPMASALQYSLYEWRGTAQGAFVGLSNFTELFTRYPLNREVARAFTNNATLFVGTMLIQNTLGLAFAVLLHRSRFGRRFFQVVYAMPYLVSALVVGYLWSLMLNPLFGPVNKLLTAVGLEELARPWLGDPTTALPAVILANSWQWVGFPMLLFGAALAGIPPEYEEAARVDGANAWQAFRRVTLPLLTTAIGIVSILTFIGNFNIFGLVFAIGSSEGNPARATDMLELLFYRTAFESSDLNSIGTASALSVCMFVFIFGVSMTANAVLRRREAQLR